MVVFMFSVRRLFSWLTWLRIGSVFDQSASAAVMTRAALPANGRSGRESEEVPRRSLRVVPSPRSRRVALGVGDSKEFPPPELPGDTRVAQGFGTVERGRRSRSLRPDADGNS